MKWFAAFVKTLGDVPNTLWGILILLLSMYVCIKHNVDIGYYFAGVGSTLAGIQNHNYSAPPNVKVTSDEPNLKVETNASNSSSES